MRKIEKLLLSDLEVDILIGYYLAKRRFRYIWVFNWLQWLRGQNVIIRSYNYRVESPFLKEQKESIVVMQDPYYFAKKWYSHKSIVIKIN